MLLGAGSGHGAPVDWWSLGIFMHELVYGKSPFRGPRREQTFENIVKQPISFPETPAVSPACQVGPLLLCSAASPSGLVQLQCGLPGQGRGCCSCRPLKSETMQDLYSMRLLGAS